MLKARLLTICFAGSLLASVAHSQTLPSVPQGSELDVAAQAMIYARACDIRYKRPSMVWDSKSLFLKYARGTYSNPQAETEKAFKAAQRTATRAYALSDKQITVEFCARLSAVFKRELGL